MKELEGNEIKVKNGKKRKKMFENEKTQTTNCKREKFFL